MFLFNVRFMNTYRKTAKTTTKTSINPSTQSVQNNSIKRTSKETECDDYWICKCIDRGSVFRYANCSNKKYPADKND